MKKLLRGKETVAYKRHIGGGVYVSVKSGFAVVDLRKHYKTYDDADEEKTIKPTKTGISLRCEEWAGRRCGVSSTTLMLHTRLLPTLNRAITTRIT